jgi:hypothetical protein
MTEGDPKYSTIRVAVFWLATTASAFIVWELAKIRLSW